MPKIVCAVLDRVVRCVIVMVAIAGLWRAPAQAQEGDAKNLAFRDAVEKPPAGWKGPVFKLSHDYPATLPKPCEECTWQNLKVNFDPVLPATSGSAAPPAPDRQRWTTDKWADYITLVMNYVKEGQDDEFRNEIGFRTAVNNKTRWFNVPWMAYDPKVGREFVHGTTNERTAHLTDLVKVREGPRPTAAYFPPGTTDKCKDDYPRGFETWSVGYYNEFGAYAIGKAFPKDGKPRVHDYLGSSMPDGLPFPDGTVVMKILTTNAPPECVAYLKGSPRWQIDRHTMDPDTKGYTCVRDVQYSRIVQIDVAVVDNRSPTRWVYGTFVYNGNRPGTFWDKMLPLGVQFGADPWTFPAVPQGESLPAQQSVLNPDIHIYEHQGCNGRLAGPVDNSRSSCLSCHGGALAAPHGAPSIMGTNIPPIFGFAGLCTSYSLTNAAYFQNSLPPQTFWGGQYPAAMSLDTSLQLQVAFQQYGLFNTQKHPDECKTTP